MTERTIDTAIWSDSWFGELSLSQKFLFIYLWTNPRCSSAGIYEMSPRIAAFDTGLPLESIPEILESLAPKVAWYPDTNIVWVKNFLRRQTRSPFFLAAVAKALRHLPPDIVAEFRAYNDTVSIPYQDPIKTVSRPMLTEQIKNRPVKRSKEDTISSNVTPQKRKKRPPEKAFEDYKEKLRPDFQDVDFDLELQRFQAYWDGHDAKHTLKNHSLGLFNWMTNARRFQQQRQPPGNHSAAPVESAFAHLHVIESGPT